MIDGYAAAAPLYVKAGWSSPLPLPMGEKEWPPKGVTGINGRVPDAAQIEKWRDEFPDGNIALRLGGRAIGVDLDLYRHADAREQLEELLGVKLPPTWSSSSRDDGSGIFLFAVPPLPKGKRWKHAPVPGVEICQRRHRYVIVSPSIHPEARVYVWRDNGEIVDAIPTPDDIAELPLAAIEPLLEDDPEYIKRDAVTFDLTDGEPSPTVTRLLQRGRDACTGDQGSRHDNVAKAVLAIVRAAERGEPGTSPALTQLGATFVDAVTPDRPGGRRHAEDEYVDLVDGAVNIVATTEPPSDNVQRAQGPDPDIRDLLDAPEPEYDWLVKELLERRDRVILTGGEGHGKTTHNRQFAVKAASGIHPYTDDDIEPVRSLFVDLENSVAQTRREFRPLLISAGDRYVRGNLVPIIQPAGIDLTRDDDVDWLRERVERNMPVGIVFLGPVYKAAHGDYDEVAEAIIDAMDHIRADFGCAVFLEAHSPHASGGGRRPLRPYGDSALLRWPEFGFHLSEQGQLTSWRGARDADRPWPTVLKRGGDWPWTIATNPRDVTFARMIEYVQNIRAVPSQRDIAKHLDVNEITVRRAIRDNTAEWKQVTEGLE
jgi:hypothetical protein